MLSATYIACIMPMFEYHFCLDRNSIISSFEFVSVSSDSFKWTVSYARLSRNVLNWVLIVSVVVCFIFLSNFYALTTNDFDTNAQIKAGDLLFNFKLKLIGQFNLPCYFNLSHMVEYHQEGSPIEKSHTNSRNWVHSECSGGFKKNILPNKFFYSSDIWWQIKYQPS